MTRKKILRMLVCVMVGATISWIVCHYHYKSEIRHLNNPRLLLVSKQEMRLRLIDYQGEELFAADIACGLNYGNKRKPGDMRTPEGVFSISKIHDSSSWTHDFGDGKGEIKGAYGPYFIRLAVPGHRGIGIHGTHDSLSIGTRVTEGCVRLKNEDLKELVSLLEIPMTVVITPSAQDEKNN